MIVTLSNSTAVYSVSQFFYTSSYITNSIMLVLLRIIPRILFTFHSTHCIFAWARPYIFMAAHSLTSLKSKAISQVIPLSSRPIYLPRCLYLNVPQAFKFSLFKIFFSTLAWLMVTLLLETWEFLALNFLCPFLQFLPESGLGNLSPNLLRSPSCSLFCSHSSERAI